MNNKKHYENYYRTLAFKFFDKEKTTKQILEIIPRSRSWLFKWKSRFAKEGWAAAASSNHRPRSSPQAYPKRARETVLKMRVRMQNAKVGLIGARFIHCELQHRRLLRDVPSLSTIKRRLREEGFFEKKENQERKVYYPKMCFSDSVCYASSDWIVRYIRGGEKVFVFHTIEMKSHALSQSIERNKRADTACAHFLKSMMELGLIDVLQVDNDAAFTGLGIKPRIFGRFVRVALYFGVELIFIPPGEAKRNGVVERVNGLWATAFWDRNNFTSVKEVRRKKGQFFTWYMKYAPPSLNGLRVKDECEKISGRKFSKIECEELPDKLPLTMGRIHYVRKVDEAGSIDILKEKFRISKSLRGKYVVATIDFSDESLTIHHRGSEKSKAKLLKKLDYKIEEPIVKLKSKYRRGKKKRVNILEIL